MQLKTVFYSLFALKLYNFVVFIRFVLKAYYSESRDDHMFRK